MHIWFCALKPRQAGCCRGEVCPGREPSDALGGLSLEVVAEAVTNVPWQ